MARPTVRVEKPNQIAQLCARFEKFLPRLTALPGVIGVTLNGGLSRGYGDVLSEIDLTIYLDDPAFARWQAGGAPFGSGIQRIDGDLYDLGLANVADERAREWSADALWDASYALILYDPQREVAALLGDKLAKRPDPQEAGGVLFSAWWHFKLTGDIWIYREDALQGHLILNQALQDVVKALFLANSEFVPHEKWLIHMSRSLDWQPPDWIARVTQVMCDLAPTVESLRTRQERIAGLWEEIDRHVIALTVPGFPLNLMHKYVYDRLALLVERGSLSVEDWEQQASLSLLNSAPFNRCVTVENGCVALDQAAFSRLSADDVYTWHYAIVQALRDVID